MTLLGKHILSGSQFERGDLDGIFSAADALLPIARRDETTNALRGCVLANLFFEPSTRSRISFGAAFARLGGTVLDTTGVQTTSIAKGESLHDTSRVISGYADVMVVRLPTASGMDEFSSAANVPVISAGNGAGEHPTQALLDIYTIRNELRHFGRQIDGLQIALIGDLKHGRTVHSLLQLLPHFANVKVTLVSDRSLQMPRELTNRARASGVDIRETTSLREGIADVDVIYMTRIQEERFASPQEFLECRGKYRLTRRIFEELCPLHSIIMHPLPRDARSESNELDADLTGHPRLAIFRQTDNGIPVRMALFALVLGIERDIGATIGKVPWHKHSRIGES